MLKPSITPRFFDPLPQDETPGVGTYETRSCFESASSSGNQGNNLITVPFRDESKRFDGVTTRQVLEGEKLRGPGYCKPNAWRSSARQA